ncbi:Ig-like domain-containing protein [Vibrio parahaemolyticus]|nr:Ig-like domain-containing protein [Vibrio parahaemolyticus]
MKTLWFYTITLLSLLLSGCNNGDDGLLEMPSGWVHYAESLVVTPKNSTVPAGLTQQMRADAVLSDSTVIDVTTNPALTWTSSDITVATIDANGLVRGLVAGTVTITAEGVNNDGSTVSDTATVTVTDAVVTALQVTPTNETTPVGLTKAFTAKAIFSDSSTRIVTNDPALTWSTSDTDIASITTSQASGGNGVAKGESQGTVIITAKGTAAGTTFEGSATLIVTDAVVTRLDVTPTTETTPVGLEKAFKATAVLSDNTAIDVTDDAAVTWRSEDTGIATVVSGQTSGNGVAKGIVSGNTVITAEATVNGTVLLDSATLTVTDAIITELKVTPTTDTVPVGLSKPFTAIAILSDGKSTIDVTDSSAISWTTSESSIATIDALGLATGIAVGEVTVKATGVTPEGTTVSDTATLQVTDAVIERLQVTPATETTPVGLSKPFMATAILSDGVTTLDVTNDPAISWSSNNLDIATIISGQTSGNGVAKGERVGSVTITAQGTTPEGTVVSGSATLTVTDAVVTTLQVTPPLETTPKGLTKAFTATALMSDGTTVPVTDNTAVSWSTSDSAFATITTGQTNGNGVAKGEAVGTVTITAKGVVGTETFTGTAQLTVTDAIAQSLEVTPETASVAKGLTQQYQAVVTYSDTSTEDVTAETATTSWTSGSNASINAMGLAKGENVGDAQITASGTYDGVTLSDTVTLTVTAAEIVSLEVTPETASIAKGQTQAYKAMANFTDSSTLNVTDDTNTSWVSSTNAASITLEGNEAVAKGDNVGDTIITATYHGQSDTAALTVTAAVLESITVTPAPIEVGIGIDKTGTLTATGYYSDGTEVDITTLVDWTGQDTAIATVDSGATNGGLVTGVTVASTVTKATLDSIESNEVEINVVKTLISVSLDQVPVVELSDRTPSIALTATGLYDDGSTEDVTDSVTWTIGSQAETYHISLTEFDEFGNFLGEYGELDRIKLDGNIVSATGNAPDRSNYTVISTAPFVVAQMYGPGFSFYDSVSVLQCISSVEDPALGTCLKEFDYKVTVDGVTLWSPPGVALKAYGITSFSSGNALTWGGNIRSTIYPSLEGGLLACQQLSDLLGVEVTLPLEVIDEFAGKTTAELNSLGTAAIFQMAEETGTAMGVNNFPDFYWGIRWEPGLAGEIGDGTNYWNPGNPAAVCIEN